MLPFFGPSTLRDGVGLAVDAQARPQKYIMDDQDGLYWSTNLLQAVDTRAQYLDLDQTIQGDQYAMIRDLYLQRKAFQIAEKKVIRQMCLLLMMTNLKMYQKITLIKPKIIKGQIKVLHFSYRKAIP